MPRDVVRVGILGQSHPPATRWGGRTLRPHAVADMPLPLDPGALIRDAGGVETRYLGDHAITLHHGETAHYRENLASARPSVWVGMAEGRVHLVTVDPHEGEGMASDPEKLVEAVPMPPALAARIAAFIAAHHVDEPFHKRKRRPATGTDGIDPRAPRVLVPDQKWGR